MQTIQAKPEHLALLAQPQPRRRWYVAKIQEAEYGTFSTVFGWCNADQAVVDTIALDVNDRLYRVREIPRKWFMAAQRAINNREAQRAARPCLEGF